MTTHQVNWYGEDVKLLIRDVNMRGLIAIGYRIEEQTKINITDNQQVDTGFMRNSVYVSAPKEDSFSQTWDTGEYKSDKTGYMAFRAAWDKIDPPDKRTVVVVVGAEYAVFLELQNSFLLKAVEQVSGMIAESEIATVAKQSGL